jgi:uncharacterized protein YjbI with pentapeptide repeats
MTTYRKEEKIMTDIEFNEILNAHRQWLVDRKTGKQAYFKDIDFSERDFRGIDLREASFWLCDLRQVRFERAKLANASFHQCNLYNAVFDNADLSDSYFGNGTSICDASFQRSNMNNVRFDASVNCHGAYFVSALNMSPNQSGVLAMHCPQVGSFIGFKKCSLEDGYDVDCVIAKLLIPASAKRSSATSNKCRASKVKVLGFYDYEGKRINIENAVSTYDFDFHYTIGKWAVSDDFDENRWRERSFGIHFFLTFEEARDY